MPVLASLNIYFKMVLTDFTSIDRIMCGKIRSTSKEGKDISMRQKNKVVSLAVAAALLLSSMDMVSIKASENTKTDMTKEQWLQEFTEVPEIQAVTASTPKVKVTSTVTTTTSKDFVIKNGVLIDYKGKEKNVVIPKGVTEICDEAFENNKDITSVTLPTSLKKIGSFAFFGCSKLKTIKSSGSVNAIGDFAFYETKWLKLQQDKKNMVILDQVLIDGTKCSGTVIIPNGVTCINAWAFSDCQKLKKVIFPSGLKSIGDGAFRECSALSVEKIKLPEGLKSIETQAFFGTKGQYIKIPKSVTKIGQEAVGADGDMECPEKNPNFTICGYSKTTAQTYAKKLGVDFVDVGKVTFKKQEMQKVYGNKTFTVKPMSNNKNVTYTSSNKKVATVTKSGKVTIKGCGKTCIAIKTAADGKKKATYKKVILGVCPQKVNLSSVVLQEKNRVKVTWKKSTGAKGYCVEYSTDKNFKDIKKRYNEGEENVSDKFSVKSGQTYYVRVCACGESRYSSGGEWEYGLLGKYSAVKTVKVK